MDEFIKNLEKNESSTENCPVFLFPSLKPKKVFSETAKFCNKNIFIIKRNLLSLFGFPSYGVHCNVWTKHKDKFIIYFAKRSEKLKSFPGYIDNTVAGGQPTNLSIFENLKKEAYEEAGISSKYLKKFNVEISLVIFIIIIIILFQPLFLIITLIKLMS